ncbi:uncharacterized protein TNCV_5085301 [Trichonephila clavipes]|uniref:Uncharacterized protein n=1 Tax=Trichonephila clavipes TaxID=2585209 RepID=A0A8X6S9S4_TRICX|nr:uncharacterized protein TNCV_5085301 [Trichonephila clavipes]
MDLSASYLHVKVKITNLDGTSLAENEPVAPVNLFLHALFGQVDVILNERMVSSSSNTYPYRAYVETLLNYGEDAKKSLLTCECFYKDTFLDVSDPLQKENGNEGLKIRYDLTLKSQILDMIGPLHCDIFQQNHLLLNLVDVKIKMTRTKPDFCLMSTKTGEPYKVVLQHAVFIYSQSESQSRRSIDKKYPESSASDRICDHQMSKILNSKLPDYEKVHLYYELLKRKMNLQDYNLPGITSENHAFEDEHTIQKDESVKLKEEIKPKVDENYMSIILESVPKTYKNQASLLLNILKDKPYTLN